MTRRWHSRLAVAAAALASGVAAAGSTGDPDADATAVVEALSAVDFLPSAGELSARLAGDEQFLIVLARTSQDPGLQLRAVRALGLYPTEPMRQALRDTLASYHNAAEGTPALILIAAIEAIGASADPDELATLVPFLSASSRDVRLATVHALGETRAPAACAPLRARQSLEAVSQVRIAIDGAIPKVCP